MLDDADKVIGYKLNGQKQFITNGGVAGLYTILAEAPGGPSFFVVEAGSKGLIPGKTYYYRIRAFNQTGNSVRNL